MALPVARYDAILCRGALNDFVDEDSRQSVFVAFASALRQNGVLILDVREWEATDRLIAVARRMTAGPDASLTFL